METPIAGNAALEGLISWIAPPDADDSASEKALQLLCMALPNEVWDEFIATGVIPFSGRRGTYLISSHSQTKIYAPTNGRCVAYACLQLSTPTPDYDRMLAEYLLLKNDEHCYWKTANMFDPASDVAVLLLAVVDLCLFLYLIRLF